MAYAPALDLTTLFEVIFVWRLVFPMFFCQSDGALPWGGIARGGGPFANSSRTPAMCANRGRAPSASSFPKVTGLSKGQGRVPRPLSHS